MGRPLRESLDFAEEFLTSDTERRIALFDVCLTMKEDTQENRETALGYLDKLREYCRPLLTGAFAGRIDLDTLPLIYRTFAQVDPEGILAEGDYRDWQRIEGWSDALLSVVMGKTA